MSACGRKHTLDHPGIRRFEWPLLGRLARGQGGDLALGAARDRARQVEIGGGGRAAGQHERIERLEPGVERVDLALEAVDLALLDAQAGVGAGATTYR